MRDGTWAAHDGADMGARRTPGRGRLTGTAAVVAALLTMVVAAGCGAEGPSGAPLTAPPTTSPATQAPTGGAAATSLFPATPVAACRGAIPTAAAALEGPLRKPLGPTSTAVIWYVVDGDTIRLTDRDYVRLIGMDTPETVKPGTPVQPYGPQASADLKALLAGHTAVVLERDVSNTDVYGRLLRFVWVKTGSSWFQLDYELVVRGDARLETVKPDVRYAADYAAAQAVAQANHVGRWATC